MPGRIITWLAVLSIVALPIFSCTDKAEEAKKLNQQMIRLDKQGKYSEAAKIGEQILVIVEKSQGPDHPDTATVRKNLTELERQRKKAVTHP